MLWNWIDRNLKHTGSVAAGNGGTPGDIWLLHSGAFYHMEKTLRPGNPIPQPLHWFKWQSYITWISGAALLFIVYYLGNAALLLGTNTAINATTAIIISAASILLAWPVYNLLRFNAATGVIAMFAVSYGYTQVFSGRAAFLHVGALFATIMAGNVFMVIMPSQRQLVAAVEQGEDTVPVLAARAKARSIHNNYLTFPVIVLMLSSHFPGLYGSRYNWLLLGVLVLAGASVRHFMNIRFTQPRWKIGFAASAVTAIGVILFATRSRVEQGSVARVVTFEDARSIIDRRCAACHSSHPADAVFTAAPAGVTFDTPEMIAAWAPRIMQRAVVDQTMPLQNKTKMTDAERAILRSWIEAGAKIR